MQHGFRTVFTPYTDALSNILDQVIPVVTDAIKYPPHNVVQKTEGSVFVEIAVAGFKKEEIKVTVDNGHLVVTGSRQNIEDENKFRYIHKGIAARPFELKTKILEGSKVKSAKIVDGILSIEVAYEVQEKKTETIDIM